MVSAEALATVNVRVITKLVIIKTLSDNRKTRFIVYVVEILYENIPLTEMLSALKAAKKYIHVYYFHGKHFTCWDLRGMLEADNFGRQTLPIHFYSELKH